MSESSRSAVLPSLPTRPRAELYLVSDILALAKRGSLRVPHFQTGLRWGPKHVADLFDSVVRGFPIGGLLLWKRAGEREALAFGPLLVEAPEQSDALFIVDGQQRVTALVGALLHPDAVPLGDNYALWVDLATGAFEVKHERPGPTWIPVNTLGDRTRLQHWARRAELGADTEALVARAFTIEEDVIRYPLTAYVVQDADIEALRLIFSRTNSAGVALKEHEVFQAMFGDEASAPKPLDEMSGWLDEQTSFGRLPTSWLLRCVKAVGELEPRSSFTEKHPPRGALLTDTREAMRRAIRFLQVEAGFMHGSVLPYRFPLIVLARFFHMHSEPHPRSRQLLTRWIWRGALHGIHGNSSHAAVSAHLGDLGTDEHGSIQRLLARAPRGRELEPPDPRARWYGQAAATRIYATQMLSLDPMNPQSEEPWDRQALLAFLSSRELGNVFRRPLDNKAQAIAARVLVPSGVRRERPRRREPGGVAKPGHR